jgi:hypothetical protein
LPSQAWSTSDAEKLTGIIPRTRLLGLIRVDFAYLAALLLLLSPDRLSRTTSSGRALPTDKTTHPTPRLRMNRKRPMSSIVSLVRQVGNATGRRRTARYGELKLRTDVGLRQRKTMKGGLGGWCQGILLLTHEIWRTYVRANCDTDTPSSQGMK